jgi:uncharacterized protein YegL
MLVLDTSGSMASTVKGKSISRIEEVNRGLRLLKTALCEDETASMRVQLAIVSVGGPTHDADLSLDWTDVKDFKPPTLEAEGPTPLARGMRLALHHIERQKRELNNYGIAYTRPWIMVISDGEPSDDPCTWRSVVEECRAAEAGRRCKIFPIMVEDGSAAALQELTTTSVARLASTRFKEYFQWLSASLQSVSRVRSGEPAVLPVRDPWTYLD